MIDDHGLLNQPANEEFHCKLSVNEEEVTGVVDCFKEEKGSEDVLGVQYDVRLSYGLNVLTFDCKVAPALSKKIKIQLSRKKKLLVDIQDINYNKCKNMGCRNHHLLCCL